MHRKAAKIFKQTSEIAEELSFMILINNYDLSIALSSRITSVMSLLKAVFMEPQSYAEF